MKPKLMQRYSRHIIFRIEKEKEGSGYRMIEEAKTEVWFLSQNPIDSRDTRFDKSWQH